MNAKNQAPYCQATAPKIWQLGYGCFVSDPQSHPSSTTSHGERAKMPKVHRMVITMLLVLLLALAVLACETAASSLNGNVLGGDVLHCGDSDWKAS